MSNEQSMFHCEKNLSQDQHHNHTTPFLCPWQATSSKAAWGSPDDMCSVLLKCSTPNLPPHASSKLPCNRLLAPTAGVLCSQCCYFETAWLRWLGASSVGWEKSSDSLSASGMMTFTVVILLRRKKEHPTYRMINFLPNLCVGDLPAGAPERRNQKLRLTKPSNPAFLWEANLELV